MFSLNNDEADEAQLSLLLDGAEVWNGWRQENPDVKPRLRRADLGGAMLRNANLAGAQLGGANLRGADLFKANLSSANLRGVDFGGACLNRAGMRRSFLRGALFLQTDLRNADLSHADLAGTVFNRADLRSARFEGTALIETVFANCRLSEARDLDRCEHNGPSIIDHRTLQRSPDISLKFLRGCGLPDSLIEFLPTPLDRKTGYQSCFISYSSADSAFAEKLHADLQNAGVRCWFAPEDIKVGDLIRSRVEQMIQEHDKLLLVLSKDSAASAWVEREVEGAFSKEIEQKGTVLFPIRLDDTVLEYPTGWAAEIQRSRHIGDFTQWRSSTLYDKSFARLLRDLKADIPD